MGTEEVITKSTIVSFLGIALGHNHLNPQGFKTCSKCQLFSYRFDNFGL
jgi:hypothetical protein